jgi:DNA polymerase III alpha subunit
MTRLPALPAYSELHCLTNFTFLRGASHAEALVERAQALGYGALAITDECSLPGVVRAHMAAKAQGLKLIIGTEVQIENGPKLVLLATNRQSYGHISALITRARGRAVKGSYRVTMDDLKCNLDYCVVLLIPPHPHANLPLEGKEINSWQATLHSAHGSAAMRLVLVNAGSGDITLSDPMLWLRARYVMLLLRSGGPSWSVTSGYA